MNQSRGFLKPNAVKHVRDLLARGDGRLATQQFELLTAPPRLDPGFVEYLALLRDLGGSNRAYKMARTALENFTSPHRSAIELESIRSLIRMGAPREAASRLRMGRWSEATRRSTIFRMTSINSHVVLWQYREALPIIQSLLSEETISVYDERLLLTTQISAWVFTGELEKARDSFWSTYEMLLAADSFILARRLLEVGAQLFWELSDGVSLGTVLIGARTFFKDHPELGGPTAEFFVERWQAMLGTCIGQELTLNERAEFKSKIEIMHARAAELKSGEAVRDADLLAVLILRDQEKLERLYFMSAFNSFREYLARMAQRLGMIIPLQAVIQIGESGQADGKAPDATGASGSIAPMRFELEKGEFTPAGHLRSGSVSFRILSALLRDAYRPLRTAELYHEIFPDQFYDPLASDRRVQQAIRRLRMELLAMGVPFALESNAGGYVVDPTATRLDVLVSLEWLECDGIDRGYIVELLALRREFASQGFDVKAASRALALPMRSVQLTLQRMTSEGLITRAGRGRATRYHATQLTVRSSSSSKTHDQGREVATLRV